jgi:two-component system sensor histidine kinase KdpD
MPIVRKLSEALNDEIRDSNAMRKYAIALISVVAVSAVMFGIRDRLGLLNVTLIFLILSLALGLTVGPRPAAAGAVFAFVSFDFFFIPPYHTFTITDRDHVLGLFVFLGVAIVSAILVGRVRKATDDALRETRRTTVLYELNRSLVGDSTLDSLLRSIVRSVVDVYGSNSCRILVPSDETSDLEVRARWPELTSGVIDRDAAVMARHAVATRSSAGIGAMGRRILTPHGNVASARFRPTKPRSDVLYIPVIANDEVRGILEVTGRPNEGAFNADDERLLTNFADQVALAMERARLTAETTHLAALEQSSALKSSLLAAVSHDLRTPLAAIKASSSALLDGSIEWSSGDRNELLSAIDEEADRLTLMVTNLLDLSRIEGGALIPDRDWQDIHELMRDVLNRTARQTIDHKVHLKIPDDIPVVFLDYVEISQVMINLIGNAAKYSPSGTSITISAQQNHDMLRVAVTDTGSGIPPGRLPFIFDTFYRAHDEGTVSGSGIGLAICRGLIEAHRGRIWAHSAIDVGTTMTFEIPIAPTEESNRS